MDKKQRGKNFAMHSEFRYHSEIMAIAKFRRDCRARAGCKPGARRRWAGRKQARGAGRAGAGTLGCTGTGAQGAGARERGKQA